MATTLLLGCLRRGATLAETARRYNTSAAQVRRQIQAHERKQRYGTRADLAARAYDLGPDRILVAASGRRDTRHVLLPNVKPGSRTICGVEVQGDWTLKKKGTEPTCATCRKGLGIDKRKGDR